MEVTSSVHCKIKLFCPFSFKITNWRIFGEEMIQKFKKTKQNKTKPCNLPSCFFFFFDCQYLYFFIFFSVQLMSLSFFKKFLKFKTFNFCMCSQTWTPLPPPSPQHLSGSSPCTSPKQATPYVRHGLAIQFLHDSIHVRIPILPNHPTLSLSLWVQKSGIHICVFFPVLHTGSSLPSS